MLNKTLYFDLDETLIHSEWVGSQEIIALNPDDEAGSKNLFFEYDGTYNVVAIPNILAVLNEAREMFERVKILTTSTPRYSQLINKEFGLGFKETDILARGQYNFYDTRLPHDPEAYLIDNYNYKWKENDSIHNKCIFLGIPEEQLFVWPTFLGGKQGVRQLEAWEDFKELIQNERPA